MHLIYILILVLDLILILLFLGGFWGTIWLPTKRKDYDRIARLIDLRPGMLFYDLGSGSGNLLFYLSKRYKIKCVGIEISPILYLYSKIKSLFHTKAKVEIRYGDFFKHDLSKADVVYAFLLPKIYDKLKQKIETNTKKGTKIILAYWHFKNLSPTKVSKKNNEAIYYLYIK